MANLLAINGYQAVGKPSDAEILIVNTCGFIKPARDEAIEVLQELASGKRQKQRLIAAGCLPQRNMQLILDHVHGIDGILGTRNWVDIVDLVEHLRNEQNYGKPQINLPDNAHLVVQHDQVGRFTIQGGSAYVKIADGCRRPCAFCAIPLIKGTAVSRPVSAIIQEISQLASAGIQEINLIAQDSTDYGSDLGMKDGLPDLLTEIISNVPTLPWIRIMYAFPGSVSDRLIDLLARNSQILPYLDIPLQHAHPDVLKRMRRPANMDWVYKTIAKMRQAMPKLAIRSTFIVGYPGETEQEFETLLEFLSEIKLNHVGVFPFSFEPGTASEMLGDPIPQELKDERIQRLMTLQEQISLELNLKYVGKVQDVLIEGYDKGIAIGRAYHDAPEIDGLVLIQEFPKRSVPQIGTIVKARITGALAHDLFAQPA